MKNKKFSKILLLLFIAVNMPLNLFAELKWDYSGGILYETKGWSYYYSANILCVYGTLDPNLKNLDIPSKMQESINPYISSTPYVVTSIKGIECRAEGDIFYPWSLQSIRIPETIESIAEGAFRPYHARQSILEQYAGSISELAEIIVDPDNPNYTDVDGVLYNKDKSVLISCPPTKTECDIPATVTQIANYAFSGCRNLKSLTIPESVTQIGPSTFEGCTNLETITIPESVTSIGNLAFEDCKSLVSIALSGSPISIGDHAFKNCESLVSVDLSDSPTSIGNYAFEDCKSLVSINISGSDISIGEYAFKNCESLVSINISGSDISIDKCAFINCESLVSIDISGSPTSIGNYAFEDCKSLVSINLSGSDISIGERAFTNCESLVSLDFSGSLTSIDYRAFNGCKSLVSVSFPASLNYIGTDIFQGCSQLKEIHVAPGNKKFADVDGVLYNRDLSELLICPKAVTEFLIPSSVSNIGEYAFSECTSLSEITLPVSIDYIGRNAFSGCTSLLTIKSMRMRPPETGRYAFSGVPLEADIYVPKKTVPYYLASEPWSKFYYFIEVEEWVTGISDIEADTDRALQDIYNMQGICIKRDATQSDINTLPAGLYIIGGKKVHIK